MALPKGLWALLALLLLAACGGRQALIEGAAPVTLASTLRVQPQIAWTRRPPESGIEVWTVEGETLNKLEFLLGASRGDPLVLEPPNIELQGELDELCVVSILTHRLELLHRSHDVHAILGR